MFVSTARTFSPYANERIALFVYGPTPGRTSKFGKIWSKPFFSIILEAS